MHLLGFQGEGLNDSPILGSQWGSCNGLRGVMCHTGPTLARRLRLGDWNLPFGHGSRLDSHRWLPSSSWIPCRLAHGSGVLMAPDKLTALCLHPRLASYYDWRELLSGAWLTSSFHAHTGAVAPEGRGKKVWMTCVQAPSRSAPTRLICVGRWRRRPATSVCRRDTMDDCHAQSAALTRPSGAVGGDGNLTGFPPCPLS